MKFLIALGAATGAVSIAVAPSLRHEPAKANDKMSGLPPGSKPETVDVGSTRGRWVTSYKYSDKFQWEHSPHWLPTGPEYLDMGALEKGYYAHLMDVNGPTSWLRSGMLTVKRVLTGRA